MLDTMCLSSKVQISHSLRRVGTIVEGITLIFVVLFNSLCLRVSCKESHS